MQRFGVKLKNWNMRKWILSAQHFAPNGAISQTIWVDNTYLLICFIKKVPVFGIDAESSCAEKFTEVQNMIMKSIFRRSLVHGNEPHLMPFASFSRKKSHLHPRLFTNAGISLAHTSYSNSNRCHLQWNESSPNQHKKIVKEKYELHESATCLIDWIEYHGTGFLNRKKWNWR